jgi:hypothetical protein
MTWPDPEGGWRDVNDIGDVMTDAEIRALGFEPTGRGWRLIKPKPRVAPDKAELIEGLREALRKRGYR